jgi:hypothetical protein
MQPFFYYASLSQGCIAPRFRVAHISSWAIDVTATVEHLLGR